MTNIREKKSAKKSTKKGNDGTGQILDGYLADYTYEERLNFELRSFGLTEEEEDKI